MRAVRARLVSDWPGRGCRAEILRARHSWIQGLARPLGSIRGGSL